MSGDYRPPPATRAWRYFQRHGLRHTARRLADELARRRRSTVDPRLAQLPTAGIRQVRPETIHANVDTPLDGAIEASALLLVAGWAAADEGVASVEVHIDGEPAGTLRHGRPRPDVAEYLRRVAGAGSSGFSGAMVVDRLPRGSHRLEIVISGKSGSRRVLSRFFRTVDDDTLYDAYYRAGRPSPGQITELSRRAAGGPPITLWIDASKTTGLERTIASLNTQIYPRWRAMLMAPAAEHEGLAAVLEGTQGDRERFEIGDATAVGRDPDPSGYSAFLEAGETLAPTALATLALRATDGEPDLVYSDHDTLTADDRHIEPWLNPDWSPDYLLARDYVGGFYLFRDRLRPEMMAAITERRPEWRYDALLRLTDGEPRVAHVPELLWSTPPRAEDAAQAAGELGAVREALARRNLPAQAEATDATGIRRLRWPIDGRPRVSIIIPTTGNLDYLRPCVISLRERTDYPDYELLFIDNSRGRNPDGIEFLRSLGCTVIERDEEFNWAKLNNDGARESTGGLLLFLNDDIEISDGGWLTELVSQAVRPDVGCVGALLLYPDGRIQHAGVFMVGHGGGAVHLFQGLDPGGAIYRDLHRVEREVSAVTGACMMVERERFDAAGGFDEELAIVGNDVDLCLRLAAQGYRNIWTPYSVLIHHESVSRRETSITGDETRIWQRWGELLRGGDPYHSPHFAKNRVDCALDVGRVELDAQGRPAAALGVNLIGYIRAEMGVGQATRGTAAALAAVGAPFTIIDYEHGNPSRLSDDSWAAHIGSEPLYATNLAYINADLTPEAFGRLSPDTFEGRYTIGNWTWELPEFPDDWLGSFAFVDEVWTPSFFVQQAIAAKSPVPVLRMPHAVPLPEGPFLDRAALGLPADRFLFLMMYDFYSVRQRKNPEGAIDAFNKAFAPDADRATLVIKMNNASAAERELLKAMAGGQPNIVLLDRTLDRHEVDSLLATVDCFVSLHRSEGFGLAIAEAMAVARPVVATNWSGNTDFMNPANAACVNYEIVELAEDYGPYRAGQQWADPDLEQAAWWMRRLVDEPDEARRLGDAARATVARDLSPAAVGGMIGQRLAYLGLARARRERDRA